MVFGWGKKKSTRPEPQAPQDMRIDLSHIPAVISELLAERDSQTVSEVKFHRENVLPLLMEMSEIGRMLENDDLNMDDIDKNISVIVIRGKKQVIDVLKKDMQLPPVDTYDDAVLFHTALSQILKKIGDTLGRHTRVIHIFAKKYAAKLKGILAEINSGNAEIKSLLQNSNSYHSSHTGIMDSLQRISDLQNFNSDMARKIAALNDQLAKCKDKIDSCTSAIEKTKASSKYSDLLELEGRLDKLHLKKTQLHNRVLDTFTKISRPLGRYQYTSSLDKEQKSLLSRLIQSPFDVMTADNKDTIIIILENVKKGILSGSISVKDRDKSIDQITRIEGSLDHTISIISEHMETQQSVKDRIGELAPVELSAMERDLEKLTAEKADTESRIASLDDEISANRTSIPRIVSEVEADLRRFTNTRYVVTADVQG